MPGVAHDWLRMSAFAADYWFGAAGGSFRPEKMLASRLTRLIGVNQPISACTRPPMPHRRRPVFAVADAVETDFDLALHHIGDNRHDLRRHLLAADLAARQAKRRLLETRRRREPANMASGVVSDRSIKATMIGARSPSAIGGCLGPQQGQTESANPIALG